MNKTNFAWDIWLDHLHLYTSPIFIGFVVQCPINDDIFLL